MVPAGSGLFTTEVSNAILVPTGLATNSALSPPVMEEVPVVVIDEREDAGLVWLGPGGSQAGWGGGGWLVYPSPPPPHLNSADCPLYPVQWGSEGHSLYSCPVHAAHWRLSG